MIKKILTLSAGVVLGSMISTASLANYVGPSEDCVDARSVYNLCLDATRYCRDVLKPTGLCTRNPELLSLRFCKRTAMRVALAVCGDGTYEEPANTYEELGPEHEHAFPNHPNHFYEDDMNDHRLGCIPFCERILDRSIDPR